MNIYIKFTTLSPKNVCFYAAKLQSNVFYGKIIAIGLPFRKHNENVLTISC